MSDRSRVVTSGRFDLQVRVVEAGRNPNAEPTTMADMNISPARPGLTPVIWQSDFWVEYLRENQFSVYFGTTLDAMIQLQTDLTRKRGDRVVFPTVRSLIGAGVTGNVILEGNEEVINARSLQVVVGVIRHAVAVSDWDEQKSVIDLLSAARRVLMNWAKNKLRADIIVALGSITADGNIVIPYAAATAWHSAIPGWSTTPIACCSAPQGQRCLRRLCHRTADARCCHRQDERSAWSRWPSASPAPRIPMIRPDPGQSR